ncbi:hypothetical protein Hanom_Chr01g00058581 [Helianthus anomalus]
MEAWGQWRSLTFSTGGLKTYILKNFYRTGGSKAYIPKNFYTKTTYIALLSEKFGGWAPLPAPLKLRPCLGFKPRHHPICSGTCDLPPSCWLWD